MREELDRLLRLERPRLAAEATAEAATRLAEVVSRVETLQGILRDATIVPGLAEAPEEVRLGATVTVRLATSGSEARYRVVGVDEAGLEPHWVSWRSEIGAALLHAAVGQRVVLPGGDSCEIVRIEA